MSRWLVMRCLTMTSASRNACSVLPPSWWKVNGDVVGPFGVDGGSAGRERLFRIGDGGQGFVFHFDQVGRVGGDIAVGGDHDGDGMAGEVDAVLREEMMLRDAEAGQGSGTRHFAEMLHVSAREDGGDARASECGAHVDVLDAGGGVRAADHAGVVHAGHLDVVHVHGGAGDEARVFAAPDAFAD